MESPHKIHLEGEWKLQNLCRCCFKHQSYYKHISSEYYFSGQREVYSEMLKNTFNIQLSNKSYGLHSSSNICEDCIYKLRQAASFRQMVLTSEESFTQYLEDISFDQDIKFEDTVMKEELKVEPSHMDIEFHRNSGDHHVDDEDDEILANLKVELSKGGTTKLETKEHRHTEKREKFKKCKFKETQDLIPNDWLKVKDRRGNGPILRENSLKLLANSSLCVFQWNKSRFRCYCCKEPYSDIDKLKEHTKTNHTLKEIEKKIITQQNRLVKVEVSNIECRQCGSLVDDIDKLRMHLINAHGIQFALNEDLLVPFKIETDLKCQICKIPFLLFRLLNIHVNTHFQKQVCHICGAGFSNAVFLNLHKTRSHRTVSCQICDITFKTRSEKKCHDIDCHGVKFERKLRFPCPYCDERFFQENFKVQHLIDKHGMRKPEFKCSVCDKVFITRSLCNNHVKCVHLKEKNQECDICHNMFYTKSDVTRHKVTHTGEKKFSCDICSNMFATKDSLRRHTKRTHAN